MVLKEEALVAPAEVIEPQEPVVAAEPEVVVPETPEPQVHQAPAVSIAPLHDLIAAQAADRLARSV